MKRSTSSLIRTRVSMGFLWTLVIPTLVLVGFLGYALVGCAGAGAYVPAVLLGVVAVLLLVSLWTLRNQLVVTQLDTKTGALSGWLLGHCCTTLAREDIAFIRLELMAQGRRLKGNTAVGLLLSVEECPIKRQMRLDYDHRRAVILPLNRKTYPFIAELLSDTVWPSDGTLTQKDIEVRVLHRTDGLIYRRRSDGIWEKL